MRDILVILGQLGYDVGRFGSSATHVRVPGDFECEFGVLQVVDLLL